MKPTREELYAVYNANKIDLSFAKTVEGQFGEDDGRMMSSLASLCPENEMIVEIGSLMGRSLSFISAGAATGKCRHILSIDKPSDESCKRLEGTVQTLNAIYPQLKNEHLYSSALACWEDLMDKGLNNIGLFYYDAEHSMRCITSVLLTYESMFADECVIAFHDANACETAPCLRAMCRVLDVQLKPLFYEKSFYGNFGLLGVQYIRGNRTPKGLGVEDQEMIEILNEVDRIAREVFNDKPCPSDP